MSKCPHTDFRKGQGLIINLKNGKVIIDKYVETKSGVVVLRQLGRLKLKLVRAISIYKGGNHERVN